MKLLLSESNGQAFGILEMLNPAKSAFHAIIARIFLRRKLMSSAFMVRTAPAKQHLLMHWKS